MSNSKPLTIHIYNNAEKHRLRMTAVMQANGVKTGPLIEAIIEHMTDDEWAKYAELVKSSRSSSPQASLAKAIRGMSDDELAQLLTGMQKLGIEINQKDN